MTEPPRRSLRPSALSPHNPQAPTSVGSQRPQPHLKDSSVYRQNRPTKNGRPFLTRDLVGQYTELRYKSYRSSVPTELHGFKDRCLEVRTEPVTRRPACLSQSRRHSKSRLGSALSSPLGNAGDAFVVEGGRDFQHPSPGVCQLEDAPDYGSSNLIGFQLGALLGPVLDHDPVVAEGTRPRSRL